MFNYELHFVFCFFLVFSVCEGSLGLPILVSMIRGFGNDYFQSYDVL
jgi:NADH-ubiquinone oxidoreductase chain 4L